MWWEIVENHLKNEEWGIGIKASILNIKDDRVTGSEPTAKLTRLRRNGAGGGFGVDEGAAFAGNEVIDENLPEAQEGQGA